MSNNEILVLKRCIKDNIATNDFIYPRTGSIVEALDWVDNNNCGNGLHGWTEDNWLYYDINLKGNWVVIRVDKKDGFIELDGKVKFKRGTIVYNGKKLSKAKELMLKEQPNMIFHNDIQTAWYNSTQTAGDNSTQKAEDNSTQTAGRNSTQTAGGNSTQKAEDNSTQTAWDSSTQTAESNSTQTAGSNSTQTARDDSTQTAGSGSTQTAWSSSTQTAGSGSTQTAWDSSTQTAWDYSTQTAESNSTQTAGSNSTQTAGGNSTQKAGSSSFICNYVVAGHYNIVRPAENSVVSSINIKKKIASSFISNRSDTTYVIDGKCNVVKKYTNTPDNINKLEKFEVIVFGSNLSGNHAGGLANECVKKYGAKEGVSEGATGQCYAFPTLDKNMSRVFATELKRSVQKLIVFANKNTGKIILLTKVGCGIAGFEEDDIKTYFEDMPANVIKPKGW